MLVLKFNNRNFISKRNIKYKIKNSNKNKKLALSPVNNTENISKIKKLVLRYYFFIFLK